MKKAEFYEERGLDRIIGLSDGVFAFSFTLLSAELIVPSLTGNDLGKLTGDLLGETPILIYFLFTFMITGAYWMSHHSVFRFIRGYDELMMRLNLLFLFFYHINALCHQIVDVIWACPDCSNNCCHRVRSPGSYHQFDLALCIPESQKYR